MLSAEESHVAGVIRAVAPKGYWTPTSNVDSLSLSGDYDQDKNEAERHMLLCSIQWFTLPRCLNQGVVVGRAGAYESCPTGGELLV